MLNRSVFRKRSGAIFHARKSGASALGVMDIQHGQPR